MKTTTENIEVCNSLLRGELAAVDSYTKVIDRFSDLPQIEELKGIRAEHARAVSHLTKNIRDIGGEPDDSPGSWGVIASAVQSTAILLGIDSAVESLKKGEEFARSDYQQALLNNEVDISSKHLIKEELLPGVMKHIASLERIEHVV